MKTLTLINYILLISLLSNGQIGGNSTFDFVDLPASARVMGGGGSVITVIDDDASLAFHNPSLLNPKMHNTATASTVVYFDGINFGNFNYTRHFDGIATFQGALQYISYGNFSRTNAEGFDIGEFSAGEFVVQIGAGYSLDRYTFGANWKIIYSKFDTYTSVGTAFDFAANYSDSTGSFVATLLLKNIGVQLKPYIKGNRDPLPFDIQLGISKRFEHLPFRIGLVFHNLTQWDIRYDDPSLIVDDGNLFGDTTQTKDKNAGDVIDNIARHIILNGEFYFGKAMSINFGYNHLRRQELKTNTKKGVAGFSFGLRINIKQFSFGLARARYHPTKASTQFTVQVNLGEFKNKKSREPKPLPLPEAPTNTNE